MVCVSFSGEIMQLLILMWLSLAEANLQVPVVDTGDMLDFQDAIEFGENDCGDGFGETGFDDIGLPVLSPLMDNSIQGSPTHVDNAELSASDSESDSGSSTNRVDVNTYGPSEVPHVDHFVHHELSPGYRHIYTQVALQLVQGQSQEQADTNLQHSLATAEIFSGRRLEVKPKTSKTALKALGLQPDKFIDKFIVCPAENCWNLTPYSELHRLDSNKCKALVRGRPCDQKIYSTSNGARYPKKVMPYTRLSTFLGSFFQQAEIVAALQNWRVSDDPPPHHILDRDIPFLDREELLSGLSQGSAWRSFGSGPVRSTGGRPTEEDSPGQHRHVDEEYGLQIILNCDW